MITWKRAVGQHGGTTSPDYQLARACAAKLIEAKTESNELNVGPRLLRPGRPMANPHYVNENRSDMRGIKPGWYAEEDDGSLSSGPFSSRDECLSGGTQPTNESTPSKLRLRPVETIRTEIRPATRAAGPPVLPRAALKGYVS